MCVHESCSPLQTALGHHILPWKFSHFNHSITHSHSYMLNCHLMIIVWSIDYWNYIYSKGPEIGQVKMGYMPLWFQNKSQLVALLNAGLHAYNEMTVFRFCGVRVVCLAVPFASEMGQLNNKWDTCNCCIPVLTDKLLTYTEGSTMPLLRHVVL